MVDGNPPALRRGVLVVRGERVHRPDESFRSLGIKPFVASTPRE